MTESLDRETLNRLLAGCEREQLHLSGSIQPHGALLAARWADLTVTHASANAGERLGLAPEAVLGAPLPQLWDDPRLEQRARDLEDGNRLFLPLVRRHRDVEFDLVLSRHGDHLLLEFEPSLGESRDVLPHLLPHGPPAMSREPGHLETFYREAAAAVRDATGYQRVMVYRFLEDGSGQVVGEALNAGMESYLGLHFPASDIPQIARRLYLKTGHRHIPDVAADPVPVLAAPGGETVDQTLGELRSVSPLHIQYLRNMGVGSSFSVALEVRGELWGLIACHHRDAHHLSFELRERCHRYGRTLSLALLAQISSQRLRAVDHVEHMVEDLAERIATSDATLAEAIGAESEAVTALVAARGCALAVGDEVRTFGATPGRMQIQDLDRWFQDTRELFLHTSNLASLWPEGEFMSKVASGVIMTQVSRRGGDSPLRFYWFRPEEPREVHWAGNPNKAEDQDPGAETLSPRKSFAKWVEVRTGHSAPWSLGDLMAAKKFRSAILRWC